MKKRVIAARIIVWFIIISMIAAYVIEIVFAEQAMPSLPPQNVTVSDIGYEDSAGQNWFVKFSWELDNDTYPSGAKDRAQIFYFNKVERGTGKLTENVIQFTLNYNTTEFIPTRYGIEFDHGTIYEFYGRTQYTYGQTGEYTFTSGKSNRVKFLTGLEVGAELIPGTNDIRIVWSDVWDTNGRINYRLLITDTTGFTQPPAIPDIIGADIGTQKSKVTVSGDKLEYIYTDALPGREYSIKVIPLVNSDVAVTPDGELPVIRVKTEIILRARYLGESIEEGDVRWQRWMLMWDPIIKGSIGNTTFTKVQYKLYRYDENGNETLFAEVKDNDRIEIKLKTEEVEKYKFKIEADAYMADGTYVPFYSSTQISLKTQIPEYPVSPEFVDRIDNADPKPLVFEELLTDKSATLLWLPPVTGEGKIDTDVYYDLYLCDSVNDIDLDNLPPLTKKIGSNIIIGAQNRVFQLNTTDKVIGYRYEISNLKPNTVYYAVLVAKKNFLVESGNGEYMVTIPYMSKPSVKVIITKAGTESDKPLAPPSPPFRLKPGDAIGKDYVSLQMDKSWKEMYNKELGKWLYVIRQDDPEGKEPNGYYNSNNSYTYEEYTKNINLADDDPDKKPVREINYDAGWEVRIHCVEYDKALSNVKSITGRNYISYSDLSKNYVLDLEKSIAPVTIPDIASGESPVFYFDAYGLDPNRTYLIWITVYNTEGDIESEPSDPIVVTTLPEYPPVVEYPTVPTDLKGIAGDTYVDLFWTFRENYSYNIKYATEDNIEKAINEITVTYDQLRYQPYVRVEQLKANTVYYFWIQAVSPKDLGGIPSEWSKSVAVKTEPYSPPPRPRGFGIKDTPDAVTENSIFYEWIADETVTYILEVSENPDFSQSTEYNVNGSEYRVTGLRANFAYYARLFSFSTETGLRSEPTSVIMVVTRKSRSEYDANVPIEDVPVGEMVEVDGVATDGVWNAKVVGINAHRLSEKIRSMKNHTFAIDLTNPPPGTKIIRVELGSELIETLSGVMQNLILETPDLELAIIPGSFLQDTYFRLKQSINDTRIRIDIRTPVAELRPENNRQYVLPASEISVTAGYGESFFPIGEFVRPVRISFSVNPEKVEESDTRFYDFDDRKWYDVKSTYFPEEQKIAVYPVKSGAVAITGTNYTRDTYSGDYKLDTIIRNITLKYEMPSLSGKNTDYSKKLTINEGMKYLFDVIPYDYGNANITDKAVRAGLLHSRYINSGTAPLRTDQAIYAAVSVLNKKTQVNISNASVSSEYDYFINATQEPFREAVKFAIANGILDGYINEMQPENTITLYEMLAIIERVLVYAGEL